MNTPLEVGDVMRNKHTGKIEPIQEIDEVLSYNLKTKQRDIITIVYVMGQNNRYNQENMDKSWVKVEDEEE